MRMLTRQRIPILAAALVVAATIVTSAPVSAASPSTLRAVRSFHPSELGIDNPTWLVYSRTAGEFVMPDSTEPTTLVRVAPTESVLGTVPLDVGSAGESDDFDVAYDDAGDRLVLVDGGTGDVVAVAGPQLRSDQAPASRSTGANIDLRGARGVVFDVSGKMLVNDGSGGLIEITPAPG
ncbi:MAG: hypothetical protein OER95_17750, partial [Acidimicrobiia bacterium]|nr:hypothetical protein [Acidimicrobiia bacterium]